MEKLQFDTPARIHESCQEACVRIGFEKGSVNMKCDPLEFNRLNNCTLLEFFFPQCSTKCRRIDIGEPFVPVHEKEVGLCFVDGYSLKHNISFLATVDLCKEDYGSTRERLCSCSGSVLKL